MIIIIIIYAVLALIPALVAQSKGRSFVGFLLFGIFLTPILALIVALIIDPGRDHGAAVPVYQAYHCGFCQRPLKPSWKTRCAYCHSKFADVPPIPPATPTTV